MRKIVVRFGILVYGLFVVAVISFMLVTGDSDPYEEMDTLFITFRADPSEVNLRDLLNYPADGAYSYYKMALVGVLFDEHPETFRKLYENRQTEQEHRRIEDIALYGEGVFQYYPDLKPQKFDQHLKEQTWLMREFEKEPVINR